MGKKENNIIFINKITNYYMNKKFIRLTESDLHRIVKESVNQVLTELDWKTYMNAARARQAQGKYDNATQLSNYANNQFKKQHFNNGGYYSEEDGQEAEYPTKSGAFDTITANVGLRNGTMTDHRMRDGWNDNNNYADGTANHTFGSSNFDGKKLNYGNGYNKQFNKSGNGNLSDVSSAYNQKMKAIGNDLNGYYNGQSQYVKGKGWQ